MKTFEFTKFTPGAEVSVRLLEPVNQDLGWRTPGKRPEIINVSCNGRARTCGICAEFVDRFRKSLHEHPILLRYHDYTASPAW